MPTPADDLKPGLFIAVIGDREQQEQPAYSEFSFFGRQPSPCWNGQPLEVLAISLPFVCVTDGHKRMSLDLRRYVVQKLDRKYAAAMQEPERGGPARFKNTRKRKTKPDPRDCPKCRERMIQRRVIGRSGWFTVCPRCGFEGECAK